MSVSPQSSVSQSVTGLSINELRPFDLASLADLVRGCTSAGLSAEALASVVDKAFASYHAYVRKAGTLANVGVGDVGDGACFVPSERSTTSSDCAGSIRSGSSAKIVGKRGRGVCGNRGSGVSSYPSVAGAQVRYSKAQALARDWRVGRAAVGGGGVLRRGSAASSVGSLTEEIDRQFVNGYCYRMAMRSSAPDLGPRPSFYALMRTSAAHFLSVERLAALRVSVVGEVAHVALHGSYSLYNVLVSMARLCSAAPCSEAAFWHVLKQEERRFPVEEMLVRKCVVQPHYEVGADFSVEQAEFLLHYGAGLSPLTPIAETFERLEPVGEDYVESVGDVAIALSRRLSFGAFANQTVRSLFVPKVRGSQKDSEVDHYCRVGRDFARARLGAIAVNCGYDIIARPLHVLGRVELHDKRMSMALISVLPDGAQDVIDSAGWRVHEVLWAMLGVAFVGRFYERAECLIDNLLLRTGCECAIAVVGV